MVRSERRGAAPAAGGESGGLYVLPGHSNGGGIWSGHFAYDENLEGYYQFGDYGLDRMLAEGGEFTKTGYVAYCGVTPLEELMGRCRQVEPRMGGMV